METSKLTAFFLKMNISENERQMLPHFNLNKKPCRLCCFFIGSFQPQPSIFTTRDGHPARLMVRHHESLVNFDILVAVGRSGAFI